MSLKNSYLTMRTYQPEYTKPFRDEQIRWFEERMDKLPQELQINEYSRSRDLTFTVKALIRTLQANAPSVTFSGYMETLMQIKDRLIEQGME